MYTKPIPTADADPNIDESLHFRTLPALRQCAKNRIVPIGSGTSVHHVSGLLSRVLTMTPGPDIMFLSISLRHACPRGRPDGLCLQGAAEVAAST